MPFGEKVKGHNINVSYFTFLCAGPLRERLIADIWQNAEMAGLQFIPSAASATLQKSPPGLVLETEQ